MDVQDFFYLAHYDNYFIDNLLNLLMNKKVLKKHYTSNDGIHYFDIQLVLDEKFMSDNFGTSDINDVTLIKLSKVCIQNAVSLSPVSEILNEVRIKSSYYPMLKNAKVYLKHDDIDKVIKVNYYITIVLVPDHLNV